MEEHIVKILKAEYLTNDVKRFVVEKPAGYNFIPGQATDVSINTPELKNEMRPFTFTGLNEWDYLEFIIKIYRGHKGVTNALGYTNAGDELIIRDVWGTIQYQKPGTFIAGGAGITPFIAILRDLQRKGQTAGNSLIFSVKGSDDVILEREFKEMLGVNFRTIFTRENIMGYREREIDKNYLIETVRDFSQHFYVCGPDMFVTNITAMLEELGASSDSLIFER
ncbi:MAG TPA: FAD-binding oxidoreductase [Daejeonella sp.]|nr:FAD-binding oxidoreductase [Daejeonella sp.]